MFVWYCFNWLLIVFDASMNSIELVLTFTKPSVAHFSRKSRIRVSRLRKVVVVVETYCCCDIDSFRAPLNTLSIAMTRLRHSVRAVIKGGCSFFCCVLCYFFSRCGIRFFSFLTQKFP